MQHIADQDVFIAVAAVADYSPLVSAEQKIKKSEESLTIQLKRNKDILADVSSLPNPPYCVGFAAETERVLEHARQKRHAKNIPLIVANQANLALGSDNNSVTLIDDADKTTIAAKILTHLQRQLN
jgi:phosphopantothenoylcysteine decarboxylase / phosphopantothenate---cysteine ligase